MQEGEKTSARLTVEYERERPVNLIAKKAFEVAGNPKAELRWQLRLRSKIPKPAVKVALKEDKRSGVATWLEHARVSEVRGRDKSK